MVGDKDTVGRPSPYSSHSTRTARASAIACMESRSGMVSPFSHLLAALDDLPVIAARCAPRPHVGSCASDAAALRRNAKACRIFSLCTIGTSSHALAGTISSGLFCTSGSQIRRRDMESLKSVIASVGGAQAAAKLCGVSVRAVYKWIASGSLPRTEYTGETNYLARLSQAAAAQGRPFDVAALKKAAAPGLASSEPAATKERRRDDRRGGERRSADRRNSERRA